MKQKTNDLLYKDLTYKVRGCMFIVYNELGFGHKEKIYQKALEIEFKKAGISFEKEKTLSVIYDNEKVGTYKPDFLVQDKIIIETKAVPIMPKSYETQLTYYLKGTKYKLGFVVNFGAEKIDIRRRIWTSNPRASA